MKIKLTLFWLVLFTTNIVAQEIDSLEYIQTLIEDKIIIEQEEENSDIAEYLEELTNNPININTAGVTQLSLIPFLSPSEADKIVSHRNAYGPFFSKAELYLVKGIDNNNVKKILPFITLSDNHTPGLFSQSRFSLRSRYKKNDLDDMNDYHWSSYNRIKIEFGNRIYAGVLTEKDEGEKKIADLLSGYIKLNNFLSTKIVAGDFFLEEGQGLLFWSSYGMPKNADVISPGYKRSRGFIPNSSKNEMAFFRGIALEKETGNIILRGFYSSRSKDASTDSVNIVRLLTDGYHRTVTELDRHNSVTEKTIGGSLLYKTQFFETGLSGYSSIFSKILQDKSDGVKGLSLSTRFIIDDFLIFSEGALTEKSSALIIGGSISPAEGIGFISLFRRYEPDYLNLYGFGFGERFGTTKNETGIYSGLSVENKFGSFSFYLDQYSFPIPADNIHNSLFGTDILFYASVPLRKNLLLNFRYKLENKDDIISYDDVKTTGKKLKQNIRTEISRKFKLFSLKLRGDYVSLFIRNYSEESGYMIMNEIKYTPVKEISLSFRTAFFRTDSFQTALYVYEAGVPGIMENKAMHGEGFRFFTVIKFSIKKSPVIYLKYSDTIKSGLNFSETSSIILQAEYNY